MIHALPGMGADHRMFPAPWPRLPNFGAHDWNPDAHGTTIPETARRVAEQCNIRDGDTLIGTSLGGMVAGEIAKIRRLNALFLIASATSRDEVNWVLKALHPLASITPLEWIRSLSGKVPTDVAQMFAGADVEFVRRMCHAVFAWEGLGPPTCRCYRIHGRHDQIIRASKKADLLLEGGHLLTMTHAEVCVRFVELHIGG